MPGVVFGEAVGGVRRPVLQSALKKIRQLLIVIRTVYRHRLSRRLATTSRRAGARISLVTKPALLQLLVQFVEGKLSRAGVVWGVKNALDMLHAENNHRKAYLESVYVTSHALSDWSKLVTSPRTPRWTVDALLRVTRVGGRSTR